MTEVFFRGYGCWFVYHRYSRTTFQVVHLDDNKNRFFVTPGGPNNVDFKFDLTCIETIGFFTMTKEDAFDYSQTADHSRIRRLDPSPRYHSDATFTETTDNFFKEIINSTITKITDQVQIGGMWIDAADCYFLIDVERDFIFKVQDQNYEQPINTKKSFPEETVPNKSSGIKNRHGKQRHREALALLHDALDEIEQRTDNTPEPAELINHVLGGKFEHCNIQRRDPENTSITRRKLYLTDGTTLDAKGINRRYRETIFKNKAE